MSASRRFADRGSCIGTPSDEGCNLTPSTYLLALNNDTGQVLLLGLCVLHEVERDEVQGALVSAGFAEGYAYDWRRLPEVLDLVDELLGDSLTEVGSTWTEMAAAG